MVVSLAGVHGKDFFRCLLLTTPSAAISDQQGKHLTRHVQSFMSSLLSLYVRLCEPFLIPRPLASNRAQVELRPSVIKCATSRQDAQDWAVAVHYNTILTCTS